MSPLSPLSALAWTKRHAWLLAGAALVALKLWLVGVQSIYGLAFANYDDALFLRLADFLLQGEWLGPYDHLTLAKGPMYPLFIAGSYLAHLPLPLAQHLLYALACAVFVRAVRPLVGPAWLGFLLFALLLFNPVTYDTVIHSRVLRQNILHSLALLTLAGFAGAACRAERSPVPWPWAVLAGGAAAAFWLTREESVWLAPAIAALWLAWVWQSRTALLRRQPAPWIALATPAALWAAGLSLVAATNWFHYGLFTTCDFNERALKDAYGALVRVAPEAHRPYLPVPRANRELIYPVSPAFASLRGELDGPTGEAWAGVTGFLTHRPPEDREIASVWFIWALRRAVQDTGQSPDARSARAFYERLAREVNDACAHGLLPAGPPRSGFLPPIGPDEWRRLPASLVACLREIVTFDHLAVRPLGPSLGRAEELTIFSRLTRARLTPTDGSWAKPAAPWSYRAIRLGVLDTLRLAYAHSSVPLGAAALAAGLWAAVRAWRQREVVLSLMLAGGALASVLAMAAIVALIDVTTFPSVETGYFSATYALWLLAIFFCFHAAWRSVRPSRSAPLR